MKYTLEDLIRVRRIRQDRAQREVIRKRHDHEIATQSMIEKQARWSDYVKWRLAKEENLYAEIEGSIVTLKDLDDLKLKVALMRDQETAYEKDVEEAAKAVEMARNDLEQARRDYRSAVKELQKLEEHKQSWLTDRHKEEEQEAERELEDFHLKSESYMDEEASEDEGF
jgi:type III secretion protein O